MSGQATTESFDDLILDPEGAAKGPDSGQQMQENNYGEDDWSVPVEEEPQEEVKADSEEKEEEIDKDSNLKPMEDKEDGEEDKEEQKADKKEEDDDKKEEPEEQKADEPQADNDKPQFEGKSAKIFKDGKMFEVPEDGTVKVKANGKSEKVTIAELKQNWSGQQAWDKKITEAGEKNKEAEAKLQEVTQREQYLDNTVKSLKEEVEQAISKGQSPTGVINKIVDLLGYDSYDFNEVLFESMFEEFED